MHYGFFDGACQGNPGPIGIGVSIFDDKREIALGAGPVSHGTNNEAEYLAVIKLLESAISIGIKDIVVTGDSQLIINQINGKWQAGEKFKDMLSKVHSLSAQFNNIKFEWIAREKNKRADALSKRGLMLNEWNFMVKTPQRANGKDEIAGSVQKGDITEMRTQDSTVADEEIRIGNKFAVIVSDGYSVFFDLRLNKCSCGKSECEHKKSIMKELKGD